jgi:molybdate transport system permease protein
VSANAWHLLWFTSWVSVLSTLLILVPGLCVAYVLARYRWWGKSLVETLISLPLVLPPVATGLILLRVLGKRGWLGGPLHDYLGVEIVFTWKAVLAALGVMSFPLLVRAARQALEDVNPRYEQIAATLGAGPFRVFRTITLPLARRGILGGMILAFARALGEFGATILVAGNIPGETQTLSLAIYQAVQLGRDRDAFFLVGISVGIAFAAVWTSELLLRQREGRR